MRISTFIRSLVTGTIAGIGAAFASAVTFAIINLYLTGHNITWQNEIHDFLFISLSFFDMLLLFVTFTVMIAAAYFSYRGSR